MKMRTTKTSPSINPQILVHDESGGNGALAPSRFFVRSWGFCIEIYTENSLYNFSGLKCFHGSMDRSGLMRLTDNCVRANDIFFKRIDARVSTKISSDHQKNCNITFVLKRWSSLASVTFQSRNRDESFDGHRRWNVLNGLMSFKRNRSLFFRQNLILDANFL